MELVMGTHSSEREREKTRLSFIVACVCDKQQQHRQCFYFLPPPRRPRPLVPVD